MRPATFIRLQRLVQALAAGLLAGVLARDGGGVQLLLGLEPGVVALRRLLVRAAAHEARHVCCLPSLLSLARRRLRPAEGERGFRRCGRRESQWVNGSWVRVAGWQAGGPVPTFRLICLGGRALPRHVGVGRRVMWRRGELGGRAVFWVGGWDGLGRAGESPGARPRRSAAREPHVVAFIILDWEKVYRFTRGAAPSAGG